MKKQGFMNTKPAVRIKAALAILLTVAAAAFLIFAAVEIGRRRS